MVFWWSLRDLKLPLLDIWLEAKLSDGQLSNRNVRNQCDVPRRTQTFPSTASLIVFPSTASISFVFRFTRFVIRICWVITFIRITSIIFLFFIGGAILEIFFVATYSFKTIIRIYRNILKEINPLICLVVTQRSHIILKAAGLSMCGLFVTIKHSRVNKKKTKLNLLI